MISRRFVVLSFFIGAFLLHTILQRWFFSLIPISISVPFLITWLVPKPARYLLVWVIIAELFTTLPFGIMASITFLPVLLQWAFARVKVDLSFSFLFFTALTILFQASILITYSVITVKTFSSQPWVMWASAIGLTTLFGYSVCVIDQQLYPRHE